MKQISKITYFKEVSILVLIVLITSVYLYLPNNANTLYEIDDEKSKALSKELRLFTNKDIDYSKGFEESFYVTLPFSQIIEYKKASFFYDIAFNNNKNNQTENILNNILVHENDIDYVNSMREINLKYALFQILGVMSVLLILTMLYYILKLKSPDSVKNYLFILVLVYFVNFGFFAVKSVTEKAAIEKLNEAYSK